MKEYLSEFLERFSYPAEACAVINDAYDRINDSKELKAEFDDLLRCYAENKDYDFEELILRMADISLKAETHEYTGNLVMCICLSKVLWFHYAKENIEENIWLTSMCDLKWKSMECKCMHNIWGVSAPMWYANFFKMKCFGFQKLQFVIWSFGANYEKDDIVLTKDSNVIYVHIPRTGTKLDRESVLNAYKEAAEFFKNRYQLERIVFACNSWLLFPRNKEVLSPQSNLYSFISDFDIFAHGEYADYSQVWRLFDKNYNGDVEQLPQDTSLRRVYADWIRKGEKTGWGFGVYVYKG